MTVAEAVDSLPRRVAGWAAARSLPPNSMTGISLALGVCAAVWFTAGTRPGNAAGAVALGGSYLAGRSARRLAGPSPGRVRVRPAEETAAAEMAGSARAKPVRDSRLARACAAATECGAYAGLAAGGPVAGGLFAHGLATGGPLAGAGMWQLAMTVVIMVAVSQLAVACGSPALPGMRWEAAPGEAAPGEAAPGEVAPGAGPWWVLGMPYGGRILLIAVVAPVVGSRGAFLGLLGWAVIAIGYAIITSRSRPGGARAARAIVACRDDGLIATEIGRSVRGQLVPLPPALTGVAAVAVLAVLGLRNLPGFLLLAPVVAMLLAAVGSSHPHAGRLDWVVPVLLQAGQFGYIAAIGVATGVPAPLIFAACALTALHYAHLAGHAANDSAVGWEGRMIAAGLGAALGMATFAYLLLAAYLGVLICREFMTSWLPATEGDRR
jgi:Family of unknown function (DUF5941)